MRFLLLIPAFFLLLSNVPFNQEISLDLAQEIMNQGGCNNETRKGSCGQPGKQESPNNSANQCCDNAEGTITCICCFQFAAPLAAITRFEFSSILSKNCLTGYLEKSIKDPLVGAPWQPPDTV